MQEQFAWESYLAKRFYTDNCGCLEEQVISTLEVRRKTGHHLS
ncbi:hypothetical protein L195_g044622, partial [Trifolium pratense]